MIRPGDERDAEGWGAFHWVALSGWALAVLLGVPFLLTTFGGSGAPTREALAGWTLFAIALLALMAAAALGLRWASRAFARRESSGLLWLRRSFLFGLGAGGGLVVVSAQDPARLERWWFAAAVAALGAAQMAFFAVAAHRLHRRVTGGSRRVESQGSGKRGAHAREGDAA